MFSALRSAAPAALLSLATLVLQGCALATATPPSVEVENVQLAAVGLLQQSFAVTLCVTNPNTRQLNFRDVSFRVAVNWSPFAAGNDNSSIRLPPASSMLVPLSVDTTIANLGPQLLSTLASGQVAYTIAGSVGLIGLPFDVPFRRAGTLSVLRTGLDLLQATDTPAATRCGTTAALPPQV